MSDFLEIIKDYVKREKTNYAVLINGDWGNGKTYYLINSVFPVLRQIEKQPIYISLNGVSSVDELNKALFLETSLYKNNMVKDALDKKGVKYATQFVKTVFKGAVMLKAGTKFEDPTDYEELISLKDKYVLCFDDLERCKMEITEILGYINNFVEHDGTKVIIVGNEKEIKDINHEQSKELKVLAAIQSLESKMQEKDEIMERAKYLFTEQKQYEITKEKVIGKTIYYTPPLQDIIEGIIEEYKAESTLNYYQFLTKNAQDILFIFNKSKRKNIRVLKHIISDFEKIYKLISTKPIGESDSNFNEQLLDSYFIPTLICNMEFRLGNTKLEKFIERGTVRFSRFDLLYLSGTDSTSDVSFLEEYMDDSREFTNMYISKPIIHYIVTSILDENEIIKEAKTLLNNWTAEDNKTTLDKLLNGYSFLEDEEFRFIIKEVLNNIREGQYEINDYYKIFHLMESWQSELLLLEDMNELKQIFKEGIEKAKVDVALTKQIPRYVVKNASTDLIYIERLINQRKKIKEEHHMQDRMEIILNYLPGDVQKFSDEYYNLVRTNNSRAILKYINIEEFSKKILNLDNSGITYIDELFSNIYKMANLKYFYEEDHAPLIKLNELLKKKKEELEAEQPRGIRYLNFKSLICTMDKVIATLDAQKETDENLEEGKRTDEN